MAATTTADYTTWDLPAYSGLLEECTGYTVRLTTDEDGDHCYQLTDAYGDADGEPWYEWADVVADTADAIEATLRTMRGD